MTKSKALLILYGITAVFSCVYTALNTNILSGYIYISFLPLVFLIAAIALYIIDARGKNGRITVYIFTTIQWLRSVVLPIIGTYSGYFTSYGSQVDESNAKTASLLLVYESLFTFAFCLLIYKGSKIKEKPALNVTALSGNTVVYMLFIAVALFAFIGTGANTFQFFALATDSDRLSTVRGDEGSPLEAVILYGLTILVVLVLYYCSVKYKEQGKRRYVVFALAVTLFRLCLINSESRLAQVYLVGAFMLMLPKMFEKYSKRIFQSLAVAAILVLGFLTIYKVFYAFNYESYADAIEANPFELTDMSAQLDSYFYGVNTVARNIAFCDQAHLGIGQILWDVLRNTFGLHYLIPNVTTTVQEYNYYIYSGTQDSGYLFSGVAYGYLYFGGLLAPVCTCFNLAIAFWGEKLLNSIKYLDIYNIVALVFMRLAVMVFANFPQTFNYVSRTCIIGMLVIGGASLFKRIQKEEENDPQNSYV